MNPTDLKKKYSDIEKEKRDKLQQEIDEGNTYQVNKLEYEILFVKAINEALKELD
jgi:sorbitol-specific phosphotransferase system component IIA